MLFYVFLLYLLSYLSLVILFRIYISTAIKINFLFNSRFIFWPVFCNNYTIFNQLQLNTIHLIQRDKETISTINFNSSNKFIIYSSRASIIKIDFFNNESYKILRKITDKIIRKLSLSKSTFFLIILYFFHIYKISDSY